MICPIWHGWTTPANADAYEDLLKKEIFAGIQDREIEGYRGIHLLRRALAGEDYEQAVVPPEARLLLSRFDERSQHYEVEAAPSG